MLASRSLNWAIEDVNAAGGIVVDGVRYKVQIQYLDHAQNAQKAAEAANVVVNQYSGKFIFQQTTNCVMASEDTYANANVMVAAEVIAQPKTISPKWPLQFTICLTPGTYPATVYYPLFIKEFGIKTMALVDPDSDNGRVFAAIAKSTTEQLGLPIKFVADEYYKPGSQDFSPLVNKMMSLSPDMIDMVACAAGDAAMIAKQLRDAGYKGLLAGTVFTFDPLTAWNIAGAASTGIFNLGYAEDPTPKYTYFKQAYLKQFNEPIIPNCLSNYETMTNILRTIEKVGSFDTYKVASTMQDLVWQGAFGTTQYFGNEPGSIFGIKRLLKINEPMIRFTTKGNVETWRVGEY
jgi:branched-chain amino acid transport system substrate-binding protein